MTSPIRHLGEFLFGFGLASRVLLPPDPVVSITLNALPTCLLAAGSGLLLLDAVLSKAARVSIWPLVGLLAIVPAAAVSSLEGLARAGELAAALLAGTAVFTLRGQSSWGAAVLRGALAVTAYLLLVSLAQWGFLHGQVREAVAEAPPEALRSDLGRLFLASNRAAATMINPNAWGGFLLLAMVWVGQLGLFASSRSRLCIIALFLAGLGCSGSVGTAASLMLALGFAGLWQWKRLTPARRGACIAALVVLVSLLAAVGLGWIFPAKAASFGERADYWLAALRLLPELPWTGYGHASFGAFSPLVQDPGEEWSAHVHNGWLQGLVEIGPLFLGLVGWLVYGLRKSGPPTEAAAETRSARASVAFHAGLLLAVGAAPLLCRLLTVLPASVNQPALDAAIGLGVTGSVLWASRRLRETPGRSGLAAIGFGAFLVHQAVDFDFQIASVAIALAITVPWLVRGSARSKTRWPSLVLAMIGIAIPIPLASLAALRQDLVWMVEVPPASVHEWPGLVRGASRDPAAFAFLASSGQIGRAYAAFDGMPPSLRAIPETRALAAAVIYRWATRGHVKPEEGLAQIMALGPDSGRHGATLLAYQAALELAVKGRADAQRTADRARDLSNRFQTPLPQILRALDLLR